MLLPDVLGFILSEAKEYLNKAGVIIEGIDLTAPPKERKPLICDDYRVLKVVKTSENTVRLIVAKPL